MKELRPVPKPASPLISPLLRQSARGRPCTVRWHGCDGGGETTVLAHLRRWSGAGVAQKGDDTFAVFACFNCHSRMDGRLRIPPTDEVLMRALRETQAIWLSEGLLSVKGKR